MTSTVSAIGFVLLASVVFLGQALPDAPSATIHNQPQQQATIKEREHRFFDKTNIVLTSLATASLLADGAITQATVNRPYTEYRNVNGVWVQYTTFVVEKNPLAKPFVDAGWGGQIAFTGLSIGGELAISYLLHRTGHHRLERIPPMFSIASGIYGAAVGAKYLP